MAKEEKFVPEVPRLADNYIRLRNGIKEHIKDGRFTQNSFCVYALLHLYAEWSTGICFTNVRSLAAAWGDWRSASDEAKYATISDSLRRLRDAQYINYPEGTGKRGSYPILINKYEPTTGALRGWSLGADVTKDFHNPIYFYTSPTRWEKVYGSSWEEWSKWLSGTTVDQHVDTDLDQSLSLWQSPVVRAGVRIAVDTMLGCPLQDCIRLFQAVKDRKDGKDLQDTTASGSHGPPDTDDEEIEFLDESKTTSFNIEDEDDDLA